MHHSEFTGMAPFHEELGGYSTTFSSPNALTSDPILGTSFQPNFTTSGMSSGTAQISNLSTHQMNSPMSSLADANNVPLEEMETPSVSSSQDNGSSPGAGVFQVGESGAVSFDYLVDGGGYQGELSIFSLEGMNELVPGSTAFIQEAARRALSNSQLGHIVISDEFEGARFDGSPGEQNWNSGEYLGVKTFAMRPGDEFGIMLVPQGTAQQILDRSTLDENQHPLFSIPAANSNGAIQFAKIVNETLDGVSFAFEDFPVTQEGSDSDYNDFIFQVRGALGQATLLDEVINPNRDWRSSELGQQVLDYVTLNGKGLTGQYYDDTSFGDFRGRRTDAMVDFDWGSGSPTALSEPDTFSVRWTGQVKPQHSETYTIQTLSDDGVRLWVDGQLLIDNWTDHPLTQDSGEITLTANQKYDIRLEYYENQGDAAMQLLWSSNSQPLEIIPQNLLYPDPSALPLDPGTGFEYYPGELLVKFKPDVADEQVQSVAQAVGAINSERLVPLNPNSSSPLDQWRVLKFVPEANLPQIQDQLKLDSSIEIVGYDYALSINAVPNDPRFNELWGLNNTGMMGGKPDADIDAPEAWNIQTGNRSVVVAVADTGVDYNHEDLAANIWTNPKESFNGIDDDGNGYIDDIHGYDFGDGDSDPMDMNKHGTQVAGIIGAAGNNSLGVVGVNQQISLMPLKIVEGSDGMLSVKAAVRAINYATNMGARVINASWGTAKTNFFYRTLQEIKEFFGSDSSFSTLADAIKRGNDSQVVFVAAVDEALSGGRDEDSELHLPSGLDLPNVISVAATDRSDQLAFFSDFGLKTVDLGAPGDDILSTVPGNGYESGRGTSFATPYVSGAAALLLSQSPLRSAAEIRDIILKTVDPLPSLQGKTVSGGRLNVDKALLALNPERRVALTINRVREIDNLEPDPCPFGFCDDDPDFYTRVSIAGQDFPRTSPNVTGSDVRPNWRFFKSISAADTTVPITIRLFDDDSGLRGSDDHVDINPLKGQKDLVLTYNPVTNEIFDSTSRTKLQRNRDGQFQVRGAFDDSRGEIFFNVTSATA